MVIDIDVDNKWLESKIHENNIKLNESIKELDILYSKKRKENQDKFRLNTIQNLAGDQRRLIMDWSLKVLPLKYREIQTDWYV